MAKALYGTAAPTSQLRLLDEIRALRKRVADLEEALEVARQTAEGRTELKILIDEASVNA